MIDLELVMKCSTCQYQKMIGKNYMCVHKERIYKEPSHFCLITLPINERDTFVHPKYSEYNRLYKQFTYEKFEPRRSDFIDKLLDGFLKDGDFEL